MSSLAQLERRVAALERAGLGIDSLGEAMSPNYLTVGPTGTVGALFTGGVQLNEYRFPIQAPLFDPQNNALTWLTPAGDPVGQVVTERAAAGGPDTVLLRSFYDPAQGVPHNQIKVQIVNANTPRTAVITRQIIDEAGISDFVQLNSSVAAKWEISGPYSTAFTNIAAAGTGSNVVTHNLGYATQYPLFSGTSAANASFSYAFSNPAAPMNAITIGIRNNNTVAETLSVFFWMIGHV